MGSIQKKVDKQIILKIMTDLKNLIKILPHNHANLKFDRVQHSEECD